MKKLFILFAFALIISACDKSSNSSTDTSFRIKSGALTAFNSPITGTSATEISYDFEINGTPVTQGHYAIIFNGTINGENYVGIALSDNPDPNVTETLNLKINFKNDTIPSTMSLTTTNSNITLKIGLNSYSAITGGPLGLTFASALATNPAYTIYTISSTGSIVVGGNTLSNIQIKALKAN